MPDPFTLVTVVFDAEVPLLEVQARSMARYLEASDIEQIIVIDNCLGGLRRRRHRLRKAYGPLADKLDIVRLGELVEVRGVEGWRAQQIGKLEIARRVRSHHYLVLDAKNHFIAPCQIDAVVAPDGRARGREHDYRSHPLRDQLEATLRYLDANDDAIASAMDRFPPTAPPFVIDSGLARTMMADVEARSGVRFAVEFERAGLLEFFLYSGWIRQRGPGTAAVLDGTPFDGPTVWPKDASVAGIKKAIAEADDAVVFGVHRRALHRADKAAQQAVATFWVSRGLFPDDVSARSVIKRLRRGYLTAMTATRLVERYHRTFDTKRVR